jgi:hypothetical protein
MVEVRERDGPRGGEYFEVDLSDGRALHVSRKQTEKRVWLGRPDQPESYRDQRGGIGTISKLLDEWQDQVEDPAMVEMYEALVAARSSPRAVGGHRLGGAASHPSRCKRRRARWSVPR